VRGEVLKSSSAPRGAVPPGDDDGAARGTLHAVVKGAEHLRIRAGAEEAGTWAALRVEAAAVLGSFQHSK